MPGNTCVFGEWDCCRCRAWLAFPLARQSWWCWTQNHCESSSVPVGFVSGTLGASTGLSGPPVIFFYTNQSLDIREFRANIVAHFQIMNIVAIPIYIYSGLFTDETLLLSAQLLPATFVGVIGGIVINRWMKEALFRLIALGLILTAGLIAMVSGIVEL